ncbi:hypothetical protein JNO12_13810 [Erwinia aphidicola]|nr:hypothetical protein [Erwinia aphidicola]
MSKTSLIMSQRKRKALLADISVERVRARRDVTYDRHRVGAEKEVQVMREAIASSAERTGKLTEELNAAKETIFNLEVEIYELGKNCDSLKEVLENERKNYITSFNDVNNVYRKSINKDLIPNLDKLKNEELAKLDETIARIQKDIGHFKVVPKNNRGAS